MSCTRACAASLTPVMFSDVAVYFSEEEWRLLRDWEKQLYTNVMREIHSALISLGYAIGNPEVVFRIKKAHDLFTTYQQPPKKSKQALKIPTAPPVFTPDLLLSITTEKAGNSNDAPTLEGTQLRNGLKRGVTCEGIPGDVCHSSIYPLNRHPEKQLTQEIQELDPSPDRQFIERPLPIDRQFRDSCVSENKESNKNSLTSYVDISSDLLVIVKEEEPHVTDHVATEHVSTNENNNVRLPTRNYVVQSVQTASTGRIQNSVLSPSLGNIYNVVANSAMDQKTSSTHRISALNDWEETARQIMPVVQEGYVHAEQTSMWIEYAKCFNKETTRVYEEEAGIYEEEAGMENKYQCFKCDQIFTKHSSLVRHQLTHAEENLYPCSGCQKTFADHSSLTEHKRIHLEEKSFKCENSIDITSTVIFQKHSQTSEKRFECTECDKHFTCRSTLLRHKRSHSEDKQYKCQHCGKGFIDNRNFRRHLRTHTGERPYSCMKCSKSFSHSSNMKRHQKTHLRQKGCWGKDTPAGGSMLKIAVLSDTPS